MYDLYGECARACAPPRHWQPRENCQSTERTRGEREGLGQRERERERERERASERERERERKRERERERETTTEISKSVRAST